MLKITFVTNRIVLTGGFYYLFIIANRLYEKGYEVKIVAPGGKPWFFPQNKVEIIYPDERKIRIFKLLGKLLSLKYKSVSNFSGLDYIRAVGWKYGFDVDITSEMSKIIPESDLVIVGELFPYIWVFESRKFKKIALFPQGYPSHRVFYEKSIRNLLLYMVRYDYYISLTKIEADMVKSINPYKHTKYFIVNAGVDLDLFKAGSENRENIIMVILRDEPIKNPDLAIRTLNIVSQKEKIKVVFVTNNVNLIKKYKLNFDYEIYYRIPYEKLAELYRKAKVFLYTSRLESFSLPPLEAMASGTAVVSTDNIGIREYAINGYNCLLDKEHNEENLANYVLELLRNDELRGKIVKNGLETAKKFSWENITEKWINMLNRIEEDLK
ncbi:glycosyltransferase family 4 protein [Saccharolobus solfataricus]